MSASKRRTQYIKQKIGYVIDNVAKKYKCRAYYNMNYDGYALIVRFQNESGESAKMFIEHRVIDALQDDMLVGFLNKVADKAMETLATLVTTSSEEEEKEIAELEKEAAASSVKNFGAWG